MAVPWAGLVTPEGVVIQVPGAGPGTRILARGLDTAIQLVAILAFTLADVAVSGGALGTAGAVADFAAIPMIVFGYPAIAETVWRGRTLGKLWVGLRVVQRDGSPVRFRHALIRSILYIVDGLLIGPVIGIIAMLVSRDCVRLGDLAAGTIVVNERSGASMPAPAYFRPPPGYEGLASSLDVSRLTAGDYEVVRRFLLRAGSLRWGARWSLAVDLAGRVSRRIGYQPAPGVHPESLLLSVIAAYQARAAYASGWGVPPAAPPGGYPVHVPPTGAYPPPAYPAYAPPPAGAPAAPPAAGPEPPPADAGPFAPPT